MDGIVLAQRPIGRKRIFEKGRFEPLDVELKRDLTPGLALAFCRSNNLRRQSAAASSRASPWHLCSLPPQPEWPKDTLAAIRSLLLRRRALPQARNFLVLTVELELDSGLWIGSAPLFVGRSVPVSCYLPAFTGRNCVVNIALSSGISLSSPISMKDCLSTVIALGSKVRSSLKMPICSS
jgi:hypothetical protein